MHEPTNDHNDIKTLILENQRLLGENNKLLKKLHRNAKVSLTVTLVWYAILIGLPFIVYFYIIQPYFAAFGSSFTTFQAGLQEIPGWKQFYETVQSGDGGGQ